MIFKFNICLSLIVVIYRRHELCRDNDVFFVVAKF